MGAGATQFRQNPCNFIPKASVLKPIWVAGYATVLKPVWVAIVHQILTQNNSLNMP